MPLFRSKKGEHRKSYFVPLAKDKISYTWPLFTTENDTKNIISLALTKVIDFQAAVEKAEYSADTFLLTANAGAIVTILGFMQKDQDLRDNILIKIALALFLTAIVFLTLVKLTRIVRLYYQRGEWVKNCSIFFAGGMSLEELLKRDAEAMRYPKLMIGSAFASYISFLIGAGCAGLGLATLPYAKVAPFGI